jgi:hypothetical protein
VVLVHLLQQLRELLDLVVLQRLQDILFGVDKMVRIELLPTAPLTGTATHSSI